MARHRVGDSYLSEGELRQHNYEHWVFIVVLVGAVFSGGVAFHLLDSDWAKWLRFTIVITASIIGGSICGYFNQLLAFLIQAGITVGVIGAIGYFIWSIL